MKLLLAPHSDDETLFASWTIIRERPHVLVVYDSVVQQQRGINVTAQRRQIESSRAMLELIQDLPQFLGFHDTAIGTPEHLCVLLRAIGDALEGEAPEHVWAPAIEEGGHEQHNLVGRIADELWPGKVTHYLTYRRGLGKSRSKNEVPFEPEWILRKLKALACYESQIVNKEAGCWPWFAEDLKEYYAE